MTPARRTSLALLVVAGVGCSSASFGGAPPSAVTREGPQPIEQVKPSVPNVTLSALGDPRADGLPEPLVDVDEITSGGPPPDGIPSIDDPRFLPAGAVDFLDDAEPVLALDIDGDARAYPVQILIWHEIVNDTVAGIPVAVTYCPLCNSAIAFDRRLDGLVLEFGTSGLLYQSALVMYDRQTESLWSHFTGQAVVGTLTGKQLHSHPVSTVGWSDWRDANPDGLVLSRATGFSRDYGRNPYPRYDDINNPPFLFEGEVDGRLAAKTRVVGILRDGKAFAVVHDKLAERGVLEIPGAGVTVWHKPGAASALQDETVAGGRDVGATGVFVPAADGRPLRFTREGDVFRDAETSSQWNILGKAIMGPLAGEQLPSVEHVDTFWFAWAAFRPETEVLP